MSREPSQAAAVFDAVAVGASAGGVQALAFLLRLLPADLPAAVLVVLHLDPRHRSFLAEVLGRHCALPVDRAEDGDSVVARRVYIAPPATHMLVTAGRRIALTTSNLVHFNRPSVDILFKSVGAAYGSRALAVVLTGSGIDGADGLRAVKEAGGVTIVQDPREAEHSGMPQAAWATGCADHRLGLAEIPAAIVSLVRDGEIVPGQVQA